AVADLRDAADGLMAGDDGVLRGQSPSVLLVVRAADATGLDSKKRVFRADFRQRQLAHLERAGGGLDDGAAFHHEDTKALRLGRFIFYSFVSPCLRTEARRYSSKTALQGAAFSKESGVRYVNAVTETMTRKGGAAPLRQTSPPFLCVFVT